MNDAQVVAIMVAIMRSSAILGGLENEEAIAEAAEILRWAYERRPPVAEEGK